MFASRRVGVLLVTAALRTAANPTRNGGGAVLVATTTTRRVFMSTGVMGRPAREHIRTIVRLGLAASSAVGLWTLWQYRGPTECSIAPSPSRYEQNEPWLLGVDEKREQDQRSFVRRLLLAPLDTIVSVLYTCRVVLRAVELIVRFGPLLIIYPLCCRVGWLDELWWRVMLRSLDAAGATFVKLGQWSGTRRDILPTELCDRLCVLHASPRTASSFMFAERALDRLFGDGFCRRNRKKVFVRVEPKSVGSGCIAHVYKATVDVEKLEEATGMRWPELPRGELDIAIKVAEDNVVNRIEMDLSIVRFFARCGLFALPWLSYADPLGALDQFEVVLTRQANLRNEAKALIKFAANFDQSKTSIRFPQVLASSDGVIVETFEQGTPINQFVQPNSTLKADDVSVATRRRIALVGARALLKMIFVDNFVHGDLHPGNILVRLNDDINVEGLHRASIKESFLQTALNWVREVTGVRGEPTMRFTHSNDADDRPTLVVIDTGIALAQTPQNMKNLRAVFRAIVDKNGYEVGRLFLENAPRADCQDRDGFCKAVGAIVAKALASTSLRSLHISSLITELFSVVASHRVQLDSAFTSVLLSVMVLEGLGRSLDPDIDLFVCARPYLLNMALP